MKKKIIQLSILVSVLLIITISMIAFKAPAEVSIVMGFLTLVIIVTIPVVMYEEKHKNRYTEVKLKSFEEYMGDTKYTSIIECDSSLTKRLKLNDPFKSGMLNNLIEGTYKGTELTIGQYGIQFDLGENLSQFEYYNGLYIKIKNDMNVEFDTIINGNTDIHSVDISDDAKWMIKDIITELGVTSETHLTSSIMVSINQDSLEVFIDGFTPFTMIELKKKYKPFIVGLFTEVDRAIKLMEKINSSS